MLDIPKNGWSPIHIGNWTSRCGCDDDVPFALLDALMNVCGSDQPTSVRFQTTDGEATIIFDFEAAHIIFSGPDGYVLSSVHTPCYQMASELIADLQENLDAWVGWSPSLRDPELLAERKAELKERCAELRQLVDFYML